MLSGSLFHLRVAPQLLDGVVDGEAVLPDGLIIIIIINVRTILIILIMILIVTQIVTILLVLVLVSTYCSTVQYSLV